MYGKSPMMDALAPLKKYNQHMRKELKKMVMPKVGKKNGRPKRKTAKELMLGEEVKCGTSRRIVIHDTITPSIKAWDKWFDGIVERMKKTPMTKARYDQIEKELRDAVYSMKDVVDTL